MRPDNTAALIAAARQRHELARSKAIGRCANSMQPARPSPSTASHAQPESPGPGSTPSLTCGPRSSACGKPPAEHQARPSPLPSVPPAHLCTPGCRQRSHATACSARKTSGCAASSPRPSASSGHHRAPASTPRRKHHHPATIPASQRNLSTTRPPRQRHCRRRKPAGQHHDLQESSR